MAVAVGWVLLRCHPAGGSACSSNSAAPMCRLGSPRMRRPRRPARNGPMTSSSKCRRRCSRPATRSASAAVRTVPMNQPKVPLLMPLAPTSSPPRRDHHRVRQCDCRDGILPEDGEVHAVQWRAMGRCLQSRALIPAKPAPIWNPPSAWAMAKRDALQLSADCWTFPNPPGPKGRLVPHMERRRAAERHQPSAPPEIAVQIWNRYLVPGMVGSC
jgi:hypothetical protein